MVCRAAPSRTTSLRDWRPMTQVAVLDDYQRRAAGYADWDALGPNVEVAFFHEPIPPAELPARPGRVRRARAHARAHPVSPGGPGGPAAARAARHHGHAQRRRRHRLPARAGRHRQRHRRHGSAPAGGRAEHRRGRVGAHPGRGQARHGRGPCAAGGPLAAGHPVRPRRARRWGSPDSARSAPRWWDRRARSGWR